MTQTPPPLKGQEQRMTFRLLSLWNRLRGERSMPSLADIDIHEIEEVWHSTFTIDVRGDESEHVFQYFGPDLATVFDNDYTGMELEDAMNDIMINNTIGYYDKVIQTKQPQSESSEFYMDGKEVRYRSIILPLSSDDENIDFVFGTTNYRVFEKA